MMCPTLAVVSWAPAQSLRFAPRVYHENFACFFAVDSGWGTVKQFLGAAVTIVYCGVISFILLKGIDAVIGLRVDVEDEQMGLDLVLHDEQGYNLH